MLPTDLPLAVLSGVARSLAHSKNRQIAFEHSRSFVRSFVRPSAACGITLWGEK